MSKTLGELIEWLSSKDPDAVVIDGFGEPHTDRGYYEDLAFDPCSFVTVGEMLKHAKSADGATLTGWKGGEFEMHGGSNVFIGFFGSCGEPITDATLADWQDCIDDLNFQQRWKDA